MFVGTSSKNRKYMVDWLTRTSCNRNWKKKFIYIVFCNTAKKFQLCTQEYLLHELSLWCKAFVSIVFFFREGRQKIKQVRHVHNVRTPAVLSSVYRDKREMFVQFKSVVVTRFYLFFWIRSLLLSLCHHIFPLFFSIFQCHLRSDVSMEQFHL